MSKINELKEAIDKFTEEMGRRPDRLRIREDIVEELASELDSKISDMVHIDTVNLSELEDE